MCDVPGGFESQVRDQVAGRTEALEQLGIEMYARELNTRDIEAAFRGDDGRALLTRSAVSNLTEVLWKEYEEIRDARPHELERLSHCTSSSTELRRKLLAGAKREAVLAAWTNLLERQENPAARCSWGERIDRLCGRFLRSFQDMRGCGLRDPVLVNTDGAAGSIPAVEQVLSDVASAALPRAPREEYRQQAFGVGVHRGEAGCARRRTRLRRWRWPNSFATT